MSLLSGALVILALSGHGAKIVKSEFIFETASFPSCHAASIVETASGLILSAWFGGTAEGNPDVKIWTSQLQGAKWTKPAEAASGSGEKGQPMPCYNPVLFQPRGGPLLLFYKCGPEPRRWWGMLKTSRDDGRTWSDAVKLPDGIYGPIKNKPLQLANGAILCPSSTEEGGWRVHFELTKDFGHSWSRTEAVNDGRTIGAIQPSILELPNGVLRAVGRTQQGRIFSIDSPDQGASWGAMKLTDLPNPNSGCDAVTLKDGRHLLVYNPTTKGRTPLAVALSSDGESWTQAAVLEEDPGEYSYPSVIQTRDELVHVVYTWRRQRIKHAVLRV